MKKLTLFISSLYLSLPLTCMEWDNSYGRYNSSNVTVCTYSSSEEEEDWDMKDWQIVKNSSEIIPYQPNSNLETVELKVKAVANTALSVLGGVATELLDHSIKEAKRNITMSTVLFNHSVNQGSRMVGNLYGQGVGLRYAYENEKNALKKDGKNS